MLFYTQCERYKNEKNPLKTVIFPIFGYIPYWKKTQSTRKFIFYTESGLYLTTWKFAGAYCAPYLCIRPWNKQST
jgi:hypothetical protein